MVKNSLSINGDLLAEKPEKIVVKTRKCVRNTETKLEILAKQQDHSKVKNFSEDSTELNENCKTSTSQSCFCMFIMCLALVACISGCSIMWGTDLFTFVVHQNLIISNNSMRYEAWKAPPVEALLRVYIFNYTNVEEFEKGIDTKLKVEEMGPYVYIEKWERVDVKFNENGTATYRDRKIYKFSPKHSKGNESDILTVPNLPYLAAMGKIMNLSYFFRWSIMKILTSMGGQPFITLKVGEFLWGYEDRVSVLMKTILSMQYELPFKKFGILALKNGTQKDLVTIYTGEEDAKKTGIVESYGGKTSLNYWHTKECNRIDGTDGTVFPPPLVQPNGTLYIYLKDLCRKIPLVYGKKYLDQHGIPVLRFHIPKTVFASGEVRKENLCFCSRGENGVSCLPSGIFNVGPCVFEAPLVSSLPHFLYGDTVLTKGIEGLKPEREKHETFVEVDPIMGIPIGGKSRLQLNIMVNGSFLTQKRVLYKDQVIFPMIWMDYGVDRLPDDLSAMIRSLLSFLKVAEFALSYGFIISSFILFVLFVTGCRQKFFSGHHSKKMKRRDESPLVVVQEKTRTTS